jgi:SAM-dependent methyltransferase
MKPLQDKLEILPVSLLDENRALVMELHLLAAKMWREFGWHYLLDLTWIIIQLGPVTAKQILDAGAGTGLIQWYLAGQGAEVLSVDRGSRKYLPLHFHAFFNVRGLRQEDLASPLATAWRELRQPTPNKAKKQVRNMISLGRMLMPRQKTGGVVIYNQNLTELVDVPDNSVDAVVAVSALEHNSPQALGDVVNELLRVLKPGAPLIASLGAARDEDWFHEPSQGWNYTEETLRRIFQIAPQAPSNYDRHDELLEALQQNTELRQGLAKFYSTSGDNAMPWGKWDPQYQPVGVLKIKQ